MEICSPMVTYVFSQVSPNLQPANTRETGVGTVILSQKYVSLKKQRSSSLHLASVAKHKRGRISLSGCCKQIYTTVLPRYLKTRHVPGVWSIGTSCGLVPVPGFCEVLSRWPTHEALGRVTIKDIWKSDFKYFGRDSWKQRQINDHLWKYVLLVENKEVWKWRYCLWETILPLPMKNAMTTSFLEINHTE